MPSDLPSQDLFELVAWVLTGLAVVNLLLLMGIVAQREQWAAHRRLRERIRERLAPVAERLLDGGDADRTAEELRPLIADLGPQARPVAAWLVLDELRESDEATRALVREILDESGAIEVAEQATRRRMPWRRTLACDFLGAIGSRQSVDVLVARLQDRRAEVRMAAARALGALGDPAAAGPVTELFLRRKGIPTGVANDVLSRLGAPGADAFRLGVESPEASVRVTSCFGLAAATEAIPRSQALALLEQRLATDDEPRVRSAAASAMRFLPGAAAPSSLLAGLRDPVPAVRHSAARSLVAFDDPAAVDALAGATSDGDRETALRSAESLLVLSAGARAAEPARRAVAVSGAWAVDSARIVDELGG